MPTGKLMTRLVIVESPTKAKTIRGFLPKEYRVEACMGHVRDLPESASEIPEGVKGQEWARLGVNVDDGFEPLYVVPSKKRKVVKELKDALKDAQELILATDEDREGESIGWHLLQVLRPKVPVRRMVFHEITKDAIQDALRNPRGVDEQLVRAQETRRILDRLVGYTVSPLLWKKIAPGLSAGRVQSVAVRLLVQREEDRRAFRSGTYWDLKAQLSPEKDVKTRFDATLQSVGGVRVATGKDFDEATGKIAKGKKVVLLDEKAATALAERLRNGTWIVNNLEEKSQNRRPSPPFTTSTLQQESNRKLRMSSKQTMQIAQKLYEEGYITYMRTDSVNLSNEAIRAARREIAARYGSEYMPDSPRYYTTKAKGAQEAHEAIRPAGTAMRTADELGLVGQEAALYDMIWKRTLASQMADARLTSLTVTIGVEDAIFTANGTRIDFPGFIRVYVEGSDDPDAALDDREVRLPAMNKNDRLKLHKLDSQRHETQPPARFTEASLVQMLEREGIGRPSTYATIISTVQDRGYVVKTNNQLVPTFTAFAVNRLLESHFPDLVDTQFTARMEQTLDDIAEGNAAWLPYLKDFYSGDKGLREQVEQREKTIDPREVYAVALDELNARVRIGRYGAYLESGTNGDAIRVSLSPEIAPADLQPEKVVELLQRKEEGPNILGKHPETGEPIFLLSGPYGWYVQQGEAPEDGSGGTKAKKAPKPRRASLLKGMKPENMTLDVALKLLTLPRTLGIHPESGTVVEANVGRFGPYIKHGDEFRSIPAGEDVLTITMSRALEILSKPKSSRLKIELGAHPATGTPIVITSGKFGPYIKYGDANVKIPRDLKPDAITLEVAVKLIADAPPKSDAKTKRTAKAGSKPEARSQSGAQPARRTSPKGTGSTKGKTSTSKSVVRKK
jgi:DNA topoisomerase I